jgi:hypothetical protein
MTHYGRRVGYVGSEVEEARSGTMDGERGNNEPGMVGREGFRNAFSRGIGGGGLRGYCDRG